MNPARLTHTCSVERCNRTPVAGEPPNTWATAVASMRCLMEMLKSNARDSLFGRVENAEYRMTWLTEVLKNGDRVTWNGKKWIIRDLAQDNASPLFSYYTAILTEVR